MSIKNGDLPAMLGEYEYQFRSGETKTFKGNGLTKREQFAMAAMQGLLANEPDRQPYYIAADAVIMADALLAELEKSK